MTRTEIREFVSIMATLSEEIADARVLTTNSYGETHVDIDYDARIAAESKATDEIEDFLSLLEK